MRFIVVGAGSIGGVVGARLAQHGHEVQLVARGAHLAAIRAGGLRLQDPEGEHTLHLPVVDHPGAIDWRGDEACLLAVKSQHTAAALDDVAATTPAQVPVV